MSQWTEMGYIPHFSQTAVGLYVLYLILLRNPIMQCQFGQLLQDTDEARRATPLVPRAEFNLNF